MARDYNRLIPDWKTAALDYYRKALIDAERRGLPIPIALIHAAAKLRDRSFRPPHFVRARAWPQQELELEETEYWPLPAVDWSDDRHKID